MARVVPLVSVVMAVLTTAAFRANAADCVQAPYDCAVSYVERQEFTSAVHLLEQLVEKEPRNLKALNLLGIALTGANRIDAADARFREALRIDPRFYPALKNLAINEFNRGRLDEAQRDLQAVLNLVPNDDITHIYLGEIYFQRKDTRAATTHYEKAASRLAQDPDWILHYAACLLQQGARESAIAVLDRLPENDAASRFEAGLALGRAGAPGEAARFFGSARSGFKDPYVAGYNQALMLMEAGDYDASIAIAEDMLARDMKRAELYNLVSHAYYKKGRIKDAYDALRTATHLEPETEENYIDLAMMCLDLENQDLGLEIVDVGLHYRPNSSLLYLQRGVLLAMKAQLGQAEKEFETARHLAPERPAAYAALAMVWMQTGQTAKAVEMLRRETSQPRKDHITPYTLAVALVRSGLDPTAPEAVEALNALRTSIRVNPDFAPAHSQLGRLLLKRNDLDGAIRELERAVALDAEATAAIYNLAQAYNKKGDKTRAAELLSRVSKLNAQERGDDPDGELKRTVVRIVREGTTLKPGGEP
jgi:predicted Zn-dependent protease